MSRRELFKASQDFYKTHKNRTDELLEAPGFQTSVRDSYAAKPSAYKDGVRPSPYGELSLEIGNPYYVVGRDLTTGRNFKNNTKTLPKTKEFNYPRKNLPPGVFPQSKPMGGAMDRASSFETYYSVNAHPYPVMLDILDAQRASFLDDQEAQRQEARSDAIPDFDKTPDFIYLHSREDESINQYFDNLSEAFNQDRINKLLARGFSEEEIASYIDRERQRDIEKAIKTPDNPETLLRAALASHMKNRKVSFVHPTGTNASGIGSASDVQSIHTAGQAVKTPAMLRRERREADAKRLAELRAAVSSGFTQNFGRADPRDELSAAKGSSSSSGSDRFPTYETAGEEIGRKKGFGAAVRRSKKVEAMRVKAIAEATKTPTASEKSDSDSKLPSATESLPGGGGRATPPKVRAKVVVKKAAKK